MRAKGYSQKDVLHAEVQKAYAEGLGNMTINGSGGGVMGDMLGMGIGLAAAGNIAPKIGEMFGGMQTEQLNNNHNSQSTPFESWQCSCGNTATGMFCNSCGSKKPTSDETWNCSCGNKGVIGNFCNLCGAKKPEKTLTWNCQCGNKGIIGNFCNICGSKKPEVPDTWNCSCGNKGITGNFCNICGNKRGDSNDTK